MNKIKLILNMKISLSLSLLQSLLTLCKCTGSLQVIFLATMVSFMENLWPQPEDRIGFLYFFTFSIGTLLLNRFQIKIKKSGWKNSGIADHNKKKHTKTPLDTKILEHVWQ